MAHVNNNGDTYDARSHYESISLVRQRGGYIDNRRYSLYEDDDVPYRECSAFPEAVE